MAGHIILAQVQALRMVIAAHDRLTVDRVPLDGHTCALTISLAAIGGTALSDDGRCVAVLALKR